MKGEEIWLLGDNSRNNKDIQFIGRPESWYPKKCKNMAGGQGVYVGVACVFEELTQMSKKSQNLHWEKEREISIEFFAY